MRSRVTIRRIRSLLILVLDVASALGIFSSVYYARLARLPDYSSSNLWLILTTLVLTLYLSGTYFKERSFKRPALPVRTFFTVLVGGAVCVLWLYLLGPYAFNEYFGRGVLPVAVCTFGLAATLSRFVINNLYHIQERGLEILYVGQSDSREAFIRELTNHSEVRDVSFVPPAQTKAEGITKGHDLEEAMASKRWQTVIIDPEYHPSDSEKSRLISARLSGIPVLSLSDYYESNWFMVPVNDIKDDWFLRTQGFSMLGNPIFNRAKRTIDIMLAISLLTLSFPIMMLCAVLIKLSSKGSVLFRQTRVGLMGKHFTIYKLRTMNCDAESEGAQWATENDPRTTFIGGFLRRTRLDEIPQCWNVLIGDMSFVGPRPERPEFTEKLASRIPFYELRHTVKPGISGWAQVIFPYGASIDDSLKKLQYELYYIKNQSLLLDLNIMLRTAFTVFQRSGR